MVLTYDQKPEVDPEAVAAWRKFIQAVTGVQFRLTILWTGGEK